MRLTNRFRSVDLNGDTRSIRFRSVRRGIVVEDTRALSGCHRLMRSTAIKLRMELAMQAEGVVISADCASSVFVGKLIGEALSVFAGDVRGIQMVSDLVHQHMTHVEAAEPDEIGPPERIGVEKDTGGGTILRAELTVVKFCRSL